MNVIIDLSSLLWRAILKGKDDEFGYTVEHEGKKVQVNGWQFGLSNLVDQVYRDMLQLGACPSDLIIVEEGLRSKQLRTNIDSNYKGTRDSRPPDQYEQFGLAKKAFIDLFRKLGASACSQAGVEADDVCAYLAAKLPNAIVNSGDGDLTQLTGNGISVLRVGKLNENPYGDFPHEYITIYKALVGDSSDNIPGALRFGEKAFAKLLEKFGVDGLEALRNLIHARKLSDLAEDVAEMPELQRVIDSQDAVYRSYALARLYPEAVNTNRNPLVWQVGMPQLTPDQIEFPQLKQFGIQHIGVTADNLAELRQDILVACKKARHIALDIETSTPIESDDWLAEQAGKEGADKVDVIGSTLTGLSITAGRNSNLSYYFSVDHRGENNTPSDTVRELLDEIIAGNPTKRIVIHNVNFELPVLKNEWGSRLINGVRGYLPNIEDTMLMASYVNENLPRGLKGCSRHYLGYAQTEYSAVTQRTVAESAWDGIGTVLQKFSEFETLPTGRWISVDGEISDVRQSEDDIVEMKVVREIPMLKIGLKMNQLTLSEVLDYGCDDTLTTSALYRHFKRILHIEGTYDVYRNVEIGAAYLTAHARVTGCRFNAQAWAEVDAADRKREAELLPVIKDYLMKCGWEGTQLPIMDGSMKVFKLMWWVVHRHELNTRRQKVEIFLKNDLPADGFVLDEEGEVEYQVDNTFTSYALNSVETGDWSGFQVYCESKFTPNPAIDLGSPKQLCHLLYDKMGLPVRLRNKPTEKMRENGIREGNPKADDDCYAYALKYDCDDKPEVKVALKALRELKAIHTRRGLYIEPYRAFAHWRTGLIHPSLNQCATVTRRYSASSPNVQQLPSRGSGKVLRSMFAAHHERAVVVSLDFSGQELRLAAEWSQDENMVSCYVGDNLRDIHSITGAKIWTALTGKSTTYEEFRERFVKQDKGEIEGDDAIEARKNAKPVNFGRQYDATAPTIALQLTCFEDEAQIYCDAYDSAFPGVQKWKDKVIAQANKYGYSITKLGARRHLRDALNDDRRWIAGKAERQGPNFCIQGSGAEQAKLVMGKVWSSNLIDDYDFQFMFPVHDELVISVHKDQAVEVVPIMHSLMTEKYADMEIPVVSSVDIGRDFGACKGLGESAEPEQIAKVIEELFA